MREIEDFFRNFFRAENWPARWSCGKWTDFHGWLYIFSDLAVWAAYFTIPLIIVIFVQKRKQELPFIKVFWLFVTFILACGSTHLVDAVMFWYPAYRVGAFTLLGTAVISWVTVIFLIKILPHALSLKSPAQLEDIITLRTAELEESNKYQAKLHKDLDHFIYAASHDLKSPISNIEGLMVLLKNEIENCPPESSSRILLEKIDNSLVRVRKTVNNMTDVLKIQRNPYDDEEELTVEDMLNEIVFENEELFRGSGAVIDRDFQVPSLFYSRTGLKSIIYNLVTNAVKYRSPKRSCVIRIGTFREDGKVVLSVEDNGLGIDMERHKEKIFGIFKRLHDHVEGSGIGLYAIKRIVEDREGMIEVNSSLDKGSTFKVIF